MLTSLLVLVQFVVDDEEEEDEDAEYSSRGRRRVQRGGRSNNRVAALAAKRGKDSRKSAEPLIYDDEDTGNETDEQTDDHTSRAYTLRQRKKVDYSLAPPPAEPLRDGFGRPIRRTKSKGSSGGGPFELDANKSAAYGVPTVGRTKGKTGWDALPLSMTGKDYARAFGDDHDSSDDDDIPASRKAPAAASMNAGALTGSMGAGGLLGSGPMPQGDAGNEGSARDALGRIKKGGDALADVDPLGVNMQVNFDSVGGLESHIQQLKEMVSLPLLYPEVFQQFKVTPPRGVLFHGPPGTGKTLVARALAASCSTGGQQISFFMRKGADCLSKWVGEAERQLRMLFDEARASQPSIIFFDEIDGLAPVRSSKQDQIHASIVSTLLALMDGMDGRGQVVVIGATNRPDSVDPALRRPGRFDREFYFPLPSREARRSIINIHTQGWEPPLSAEFKDKLSMVTKGYGGADLRALCTEAALNAIQRRYPQIYQTTDRLLLEPDTIRVEAKDIMMSVNKVVPSSARSSSSAAAPLPEHLQPLLGRTVTAAIAALDKMMPAVSKRNPLEEALWEPEDGGGGGGGGDDQEAGFSREMMLQSFDAMRVFRPRLVIAGAEGMGQAYVGSALLHHLEGYHVQSLDIGALMGDSARTPEAALVQLFVEAKRHRPSVIYIPGLVHWAQSVSETVKSTTKALLDELSPSDPVLLLAVAEGPLRELPPDVARWFGYLRDNKVSATAPDTSSRSQYFDELLATASKPPVQLPDAVPRRRRVLEELPKAPPRPPRLPTQAELQQQAADDQRTLEHLKYRLGPVLNDLRKKFKKFTRDVWDEYNISYLVDELGMDHTKTKGKIVIRIRYEKGRRPHHRRQSSADATLLAADRPRGESAPIVIEGHDAAVNGGVTNGTETNGGDDQDVSMSQPMTAPNGFVSGGADGPNGEVSATVQALGHSAEPRAASDAQEDPLFDYRDLTIYTMNLERMQKRLYYNGYLTIGDFLDDLGKIVANAEAAQEVDTDRMVRAHQMRNLANVMLDQYIDPAFRAECERMSVRQRAREAEKSAAEEAAKASAAAIAMGTAPPSRPAGERFSARVQRQPPEHRVPVDVLAIERANKRSRTSEDSNSGERKRAKSAVVEELDAAVRLGEVSSAAVEDSSGFQAQAQAQAQLDPSIGPGVHLRHEREENATAPESVDTAGSATAADYVDPSGSAKSPTSVDPSSIPALPLHVPQQSQQPVTGLSKPATYPPFVCPLDAVERLRAHLLAKTSAFNVDQLLQLRAACFDAVWHRRSEWDRTALLEELGTIVEEVAEAVRAEQLEEQA